MDRTIYESPTADIISINNDIATASGFNTNPDDLDLVVDGEPQ